MSKAPSQKLSLAAAEAIPLDQLEIHEDNVRKSDEDENGIQDLAADIAGRGLLQSLSVRPILNADGAESGRYGIQAGSRRFRALKLLVKQKKLAKNAAVPCIVKRDGYAEADSLAENVQRQALKPLDEFRAFKAMADKGHGEDTIAAAFRVSPLVVRQRLRLANASTVIIEAYEKEDITLEQLMAFCLTDNHARQEQAFEAMDSYYNKGPEQIRRLLTEKSIATDDRRALFIGIDAYTQAGGAIERDLFSEDDEGYLIDTDLVNRLVSERLAATADRVRAEGWAWVEHAIDFPWNHRRDYRAIPPVTPALTDDEEADYETLAQELDELESFAEEDLTAEDGKRIAAIKVKLAKYDKRVPVYADEQKAKAGAFVSLDHDGKLVVERGFRRSADSAAGQKSQRAVNADSTDVASGPDGNVMSYETGEPARASMDDDGAELPDRLLTELTAYHSLGLRNALAQDFRMAFVAVLHALTLKLFYRYSNESCVQIDAKDGLCADFPGLAEFKAAQEIAARHETFEKMLPEQEHALWDFLFSLDSGTQDALFAHCAGLTVNALYDSPARQNKRRHGLQLAQALQLNMNEQGFVTTAPNYLGRIKKQQILETVAEAKDSGTAELLADLKKKDMAAEAERLLAGTNWLPEVLRTSLSLDENVTGASDLPAFLDDEEPALQAAE